MKEKLIKALHNYWNDINIDIIRKTIEKGENGAEELLDWCISDYDKVGEEYKKLHNLNNREYEQVLDKHYGDYRFMYDEINYIEDLDNVWDLCNWYLDYTQNNLDEKFLDERLDEIL